MYTIEIQGESAKINVHLKNKNKLKFNYQISNSSKSNRYDKLNDLFKAVYGVDNLNAEGKELLGLSLLRQHQLVASETILIGDTEYDYRVAKELGCRAVLVSHGHIDHNRLLGCGVPVVSSVAALAHCLNFNQ